MQRSCRREHQQLTPRQRTLLAAERRPRPSVQRRTMTDRRQSLFPPGLSPHRPDRQLTAPARAVWKMPNRQRQPPRQKQMTAASPHLWEQSQLTAGSSRLVLPESLLWHWPLERAPRSLPAGKHLPKFHQLPRSLTRRCRRVVSRSQQQALSASGGHTGLLALQRSPVQAAAAEGWPRRRCLSGQPPLPASFRRSPERLAWQPQQVHPRLRSPLRPAVRPLRSSRSPEAWRWWDRALPLRMA
jgi:hypothetical protein